MKSLRKLTALLAVMTLLLTLWASMAVSATTAPAAQQEEMFYFGRSVLEKMDNGKALCYAYDKLVAACRQLVADVDISHRTYEINRDEAFVVRDAVVGDHPDFFWLEHLGMTTSNGVILSFHIDYGADVASYQAALNTRVAELTADLKDKSDYDKSLILHDRVCDAVVYEFSAHDQTVIGSLLDGKAVCAGYAHAYQMLLQAVGIPCFFVSGTSQGQNHAWNLVQLDGEWYYTDVTWDDKNDPDPTGQNRPTIFYTYLNNTFDQIEEDHTADSFLEDLPRSTATKHNFYVKNGLVIDPTQGVDIAKLAQGFKATCPPQVYCLGDDVNEGYLMVARNLSEIGEAMIGESVVFNGNTGSMLGRGCVYYIEFAHAHTFQDTTVAPTCTMGGSIRRHCAVCGLVLKEVLPALNHDMAWQKSDTHHTHSCQRCHLVTLHDEHVFNGDVCTTCGYSTATVTYGDVNNDSRVNLRDVGLLQQYLASWSVSINKDASDVNGDGRVNLRDVGLLQQYLANWNVTLGPT